MTKLEEQKLKIKTVTNFIENEVIEIVSLEGRIKNEEVAMREFPDNPAKEKAQEEFDARMISYKDQIVERQKSIKILEELKEDYENEDVKGKN